MTHASRLGASSIATCGLAEYYLWCQRCRCATTRQPSPNTPILYLISVQYSRLSDIYGRKALLLASYVFFSLGIVFWYLTLWPYADAGSLMLDCEQCDQLRLLAPCHCQIRSRDRFGGARLHGVSSLKWHVRNVVI